MVALASVCSDPKQRGSGYGAHVVTTALHAHDPRIPVLFQTGVPAFYLKLGARELQREDGQRRDNRRPFWEPHTMVYPAEASWPAGEIDLNGPGW